MLNEPSWSSAEFVAVVSNDVISSVLYIELAIKGTSSFYYAKIRTIDCFILSAELINSPASSMKAGTLDTCEGSVLRR